MGSEEGATLKRITRSVASAAPPPPKKSRRPEAPRGSRSSDEHPLLSRDELFSCLPGRRQQLVEILQAIGPLDSPMIPLLVYGSASTGKTRAVLQIFRHLGRPFAYVSCRSCHNPRILFQSILDQLTPIASGRCERASQFVNLLKTAVSRNSSDGDKGTRECGNGNMVYMVFDNLELVRNWRSKNSSFLPLLFKIHDMVKATSLGLIFISSATPEAYYADFGSTEPLSVFFPDYTEGELSWILSRNHSNPDLYSSFLQLVLSSFVRVSRRIDELSLSLEPLYRKYCEPLADASVVPDEATKRRLFATLQPHIKCALNENFKATTDIDPDRCVAKKGSADLDFHMSVSAKYLLISAFLASRNPATLDGSMFDMMGSTNNQKRKRKLSETSLQHKENKAEELHMKGPGSFSLERLLAIFQCITSVADVTLEDDDGALQDNAQAEVVEIGLMSDVLLQLSTLCNANFIAKGGSCPLECSTRYRSTIDEDLALKVARSVDFPLLKYIYRR